MKTAKRTRIAALLAALVLGTPLAASAASVNVDLNTGTAGVQATADAQPGATVGATMNFVGDGTVTNVSGTLNYNVLQVTAAATNGSGASCSADNVLGRVAFTTTSGSGAAIGDQVICNVTFTVLGTNVPPVTSTLSYTIQEFADGTGTSAGGTINIIAAPAVPEANIVTTPAPGPVVISDPVGGGATNSVINISNTGNAASTLTVNSPGGVFTATLSSGTIAATSGTATLTVGCAATGAGPFNATVTLTTQDPQTPTYAFAFTCNGVTAPEFASTPAAGGAIGLLGAPGSVLTGSVTLQNVGSAPLTVTSCVGAGGFTVTSPTFPATIQPAGSAAVNFTCTAPATAGGSIQGTLTCSGINDADEPTATYTLLCSSQVLAVPTMTLGGKALLATLLAGLGLLGFAMRRKFA